MRPSPSCRPPDIGRFWPQLLLTCLLAAAPEAATIEAKVDVDAREIPRNLLHARIELPVRSGELALWYAKWIPGIHGPRGPIQNMAGLRIVSDEGGPFERYEWLLLLSEDLPRLGLEHLTSSINGIGEDDFESVDSLQGWEGDLLPHEFIHACRLGYSLEYGDEPSAAQKKVEEDEDVALALDSIGLTVAEDGVIKSDVVPGMPADMAGLAPGMQIFGVNSRKVTLERFREAIKASVTSGQIALLVLDRDVFATYVIGLPSGRAS